MKNEEEEDQKEESWSNRSGQSKTESNGQRSLIREDRGPEMKVKTENKGSEMKWLKWNNRTFEQIMKMKMYFINNTYKFSWKHSMIKETWNT